MTIDIISYFYRYDFWATGRLLDSMEQLTPEEYTAPGCSGNGSIRDTFAHLLSTHHGWFSWYDGSMTVAEAIRPLIRGEEIPTVALARERWAQVGRQMEAFLATLTEERLHEPLPWSLPNGMSGETIRWKMMLHTANHGTHTRAQIVATIRRLGHTPSNVDLLNLVLTNG